MVMFQEHRHKAEFLISEGNGKISREEIIVVSGTALPAGQLLQLDDATGNYLVYGGGSTRSDASEGSKEGKPKATTRAGGEKHLAILWDALPASDEDRDAVGCIRMAEVVGELITGIDPAAIDILELHQMIIIR